ncbi:MAG: hypothetical protein WCD42_01915, partial [Rhizomicrobium sp.]
LELVGGRQQNLALAPADNVPLAPATDTPVRLRPHPLVDRITEDETAAHKAFVAKELGDNPVWAKYDA